MRRGIGIAILAVIALLAIWVLSDSRNRLLLSRPIGNTAANDPFQTISLSVPEARARLEARDLTFDHTQQGGQCLTQTYDESAAVHVFADESWRRGTVCLVERNGSVAEVVWHFDPLAP